MNLSNLISAQSSKPFQKFFLEAFSRLGLDERKG